VDKRTIRVSCGKENVNKNNMWKSFFIDWKEHLKRKAAFNRKLKPGGANI